MLTKKEEKMNYLEQTFKKLKMNPLFQLSTGSKELFHSNFLYWLSIKYPEKFGEIFADLSGENDLGDFEECKREEKNIDLTLIYKNKNVYIENKIKSIPTKIQLDKYSKRVHEDGVFLFLGLDKPSFFERNNEYKKWKYISYHDLSKKIKCIKNKSRYIKDYIKFIDLLTGIRSEFRVKLTEPFNYFDQNILEEWKKLRIHDLFLKRKYRGIGNRIKESLGESIKWKEKSGWLQTDEWKKINSLLECTYNNGKGTLTLFYRIDDNWLISIQLEGNQYRHFLFFIDDEKKLENSEQKKIIKIAKELKDRNIWFDSKLKSTWNLDAEGEGRKSSGFNQYFTKRKDYQELSLYRYVKLENKKVKDVVKAFISDLKYIKNNKNIIKYYLIQNR